MGIRVEHVFETHNHADHVSGHGRLAAATGATIHIHRAAEPSYEHEPFDDIKEERYKAPRAWRRMLHSRALLAA
jgi:glyoxylase-like metal-dependent hydrolase (beta-lactamase superfamily II)